MRAKDKLVKALTERGAPELMIQHAKQGLFDDYESEFDSPIVELVNAAMAANMPDIAERAKQGEFDGTKEDSDAWAASPEGQATIAEVSKGGRV